MSSHTLKQIICRFVEFSIFVELELLLKMQCYSYHPWCERVNIIKAIS